MERGGGEQFRKELLLKRTRSNWEGLDLEHALYTSRFLAPAGVSYSVCFILHSALAAWPAARQVGMLNCTSSK